MPPPPFFQSHYRNDTPPPFQRSTYGPALLISQFKCSHAKIIDHSIKNQVVIPESSTICTNVQDYKLGE